MRIPAFAPSLRLLLLLAAASSTLHAAKPKPPPPPPIPLHTEITSAAPNGEKISFRLFNDSGKDITILTPGVPRTDSQCSILAGTTDGLVHLFNHTPVPWAAGDAWPTRPLPAHSDIPLEIKLTPAEWPELASSWNRTCSLAIDYGYPIDADKLPYVDVAKGDYDPGARTFALTPAPVPSPAGAEAAPSGPVVIPEDQKFRIEIISVTRKKISITVHNDSDLEGYFFHTSHSWGDSSFRIVATTDDGLSRSYGPVGEVYTRNFPDTRTVPAHGSATEDILLFPEYWPGLFAKWKHITTLAVVYSDLQFSMDELQKDDPTMKLYPRSIGGLPKAVQLPSAMGHR